MADFTSFDVRINIRPFTVPVSYNLIYSFDEAPIIVESYLHSLFNNLPNRYQVFCDGRNM